MGLKFENIPIIVINLKDREDRKLWIQHHLADNDIFSYKVFEATYEKDGVSGLLLTMTSIMMGLVEQNYPYALILEDDAQFLANHPIRKIKAALKELPDDFDTLYLGCNLEKPDSKMYSKSLIKIFTAKAAHAIVYSNSGMKKILSGLQALTTPIPYDELLINEVQRDEKSFATKTLIMGQREGFSDIQRKVVSYNNMLKRRFTLNTKNLK